MIAAEGVWKSYPTWRGSGRTVRGLLARRVPLLDRRDRHWALRDVSFSAQAGECVGVIGPNGAGKSTLLRLVAGLGRPTRGEVRARGERAAVLSLGDTLDPYLTGSENAHTAALVAGLRSAEARALVPAALAFAELEDVAEAPVRTYSDGMRLRLAFGVVAQLAPQVLIVDEVLAVGDLAFQARCLERIRELRAGGTAVVMASHDLGQVAEQCDHAIWLEGGGVRARGPGEEVVDAYREEARERARAATPEEVRAEALRLGQDRVGTQELTLEDVAIARDGERLRVSAVVAPHGAGVLDPIVAVTIARLSDELTCMELSTIGSGVRLGRVDAARPVELVVERLDLRPGEYAVDLGVYSADWQVVHDFQWHAHRLVVDGPPGGEGALRPPHSWRA